ncbi:MAG: glucan biosynthesis protein C [Flavobacteriales bacterium]|jgi:glucan biosynthesis protein C
MNSVNERLHYMDNLRAIVMIAGVFFHASLAYAAYLNPIWFTADVVQSKTMEVGFNFLHVWRMPLFFVISGFFTALLIQRRGMDALFKNRLLRVLLPLFIFWPLVAAALIMPIGWALENVQNKSPLLNMIAYMQNIPDAPKPPPTLAHLWFLYYLMIFYVLTWGFRQLPFAKLKEMILAIHPLIAVCLLPLLLLPGLSIPTIPYPAPDAFMPQAWAILFFGPFFAYGYFLFSSSRLLDYFERSWPLLLAASCIIYVPMVYLYPDVIDFQYQNPEWKVRLPLILCIAYIATLMSIMALVGAKKLLDIRNGFMRYMSDATYCIYIVHMPIVLIIQYWLLDQEGGVAYKFLVSSLGTLAICFVSYALLVRWTPIGWLLSGKRKPMFSDD